MNYKELVDYIRKNPDAFKKADDRKVDFEHKCEQWLKAREISTKK